MRDDIDAAIERGLFDAHECAQCTDECRAFVHAARDQRQRALDARERYRHRNARLQRRAEERSAQRAAPVAPAAASASVPATPALPSAAAAALARARAKAAERHKP
ncbi:hypothetical protein GCM10025759_21000 [Lysobacter panacisoli]|uniref:Ferredoxin n=2 Tax=Lysobacter panacisoli TaxID=1255263 RepID=A0ABP9LHC8_9GAMM